jgi:hypothetical protein
MEHKSVASMVDKSPENQTCSHENYKKNLVWYDFNEQTVLGQMNFKSLKN